MNNPWSRESDLDDNVYKLFGSDHIFDLLVIHIFSPVVAAMEHLQSSQVPVWKVVLIISSILEYLNNTDFENIENLPSVKEHIKDLEQLRDSRAKIFMKAT